MAKTNCLNVLNLRSFSVLLTRYLKRAYLWILLGYYAYHVHIEFVCIHIYIYIIYTYPPRNSTYLIENANANGETTHCSQWSDFT